MRSAVLLLASMGVGVLLAGGVAQAIINGQPDRKEHPYVGMVYNGEYVCSGTLISPTVFLTVAHCTQAYERADLQVRVTFESRADFDSDAAYTGTPYTHPKWDGFPDFPDVGVVVLEEAVDTGAGYGRLPEAGIVERFETGKELLTVVGYGVRGFETGGGKPEPTAGGIREKSTVEYFGTEGAANSFGAEGYYIKTREASAGEGGEGTCFGDSGGPHFLPHDQRTVVAVSSFGVGNVGVAYDCGGASYAQRVDLEVVLGWVRGFP
jgi:hypothetical protein